MVRIKQTLDLELKRFEIESEGSDEVYVRIYFDRYEISGELIHLYVVNKTFTPTYRETATYVGSVARENVQIIEKKEAEE